MHVHKFKFNLLLPHIDYAVIIFKKIYKQGNWATCKCLKVNQQSYKFMICKKLQEVRLRSSHAHKPNFRASLLTTGHKYAGIFHDI